MSSFEPSDWKKTRIPKLSQLDSLQRCLICKDYLKAPVITSCNHTFCSQCIRQHLLSINYCPLCKSELFESNLKRAILLEEIVLCYQAVRDDLIAALGNDELMAREVPKLEVIEVNDMESDAEKPALILSAQGPSKPESSPSSLVQCPVCNVKMKAKHLQTSHLDYCLNGTIDPHITKSPSAKRKANDVSLFFRQKQAKPLPQDVDHEHFYFSESHKHHSDKKRLPKVDFASLSTSKVKEKLASLKLPTLGSRHQLELRYNHYYILYNSNLDSNHLVPEIQLRQKLNQWEKSHQAFSSPSATNIIFGDQLSLKSLTDKDFPVNAWLEKYKDEFRDLVKAAKWSRNPKPKYAETLGPKALDLDSQGDTLPFGKANVQGAPAVVLENPDALTAPRASEISNDAFDFRNSNLFS